MQEKKVKQPLKHRDGVQEVVMPVMNPNAAGIDVGDTMHAVAVPPGRCAEPVRKFGAFTCDLQAIVAWLVECGIDTVAMESTGVYWKPLYAMLNKKSRWREKKAKEEE